MAGFRAVREVVQAVANGGTGGPRIPDDALVVRGGGEHEGKSPGGNSISGLTRGIGPHPDGPVGFSAESAEGATFCQLCANIKQNEVGVTTAGAIRLEGGDVVPTTGRSPTHVTVTNLSPTDANKLLTPVVQNPVPKEERRTFEQ